MQVYKKFDIGTDKIPVEERAGIPHHLLDFLEPDKQFTAADFINLASLKIKEIKDRNRIPLITGGTGLYLKALLEGLFPDGESSPSLRETLEKEAKEKGLHCLWLRLLEVDPMYAQKIGRNDKIRIIRALEVYLKTKKPLSEHFLNTRSPIRDLNVIKIGLKLERKALYKRIEERVEKMFERGIIDEVKNLLELGIRETSPPFRALGYKHVLRFIRNEISLDETISLTKRDTRRYAKRQITWFKKMKDVAWFSPDDLISMEKYIEENLI